MSTQIQLNVSELSIHNPTLRNILAAERQDKAVRAGLCAVPNSQPLRFYGDFTYGDFTYGDFTYADFTGTSGDGIDAGGSDRRAGRTSGGGGGGCFVTTAAYGDAHHPMVEAFRSLRDEVLVNHKIGRAFTKVYNKVGPVAADFIREKPMVCAATRAVLTPLAKTVQFVRGVSAEKRAGPN